MFYNFFYNFTRIELFADTLEWTFICNARDAGTGLFRMLFFSDEKQIHEVTAIKASKITITEFL